MARRLERREFFRLSGAAAAAGLLRGTPLSWLSSETGRRPNILFIVVDDLRPELGCYGLDCIKTPNIDRIAQSGIVFTRAYAQQALCNPSRASVLTGMRPASLNVWNNDTHFRRTCPDVATLPYLLKQNGYESVAVGKIFHSSLPDPPSWSQPEPFVPERPVYMSPETQARQDRRLERARRLGYPQSWINSFIRGPATECHEAPDSMYLDGALADATMMTLSSLRKKEPFFLAVGFVKPHLPFVAPKRYWDLYDREAIALADNDRLPEGAPIFAMNRMTEFASYADFSRVPSPTERRISEDQARLLKHGYYACVSFIDAQIGRVMGALDHFGLRENTIVVIWSDHGFKLGEHGSWGKLTNYEIDVRTPLLISVPGQKNPGSCSPALVELVDIYPTLCELSGLAAPGGLEGTSLVPLLEDPERPWKSAAFSHFVKGYADRLLGRAMRTERYRYVEWLDRIDEHVAAVELYDHETDPGENVNVASAPENAELVAGLSKMLEAGWKAALPK